ncbi:MAG: DnaD domain protein [Dehalococcoidia bacterium]|nr:DnaD domain protein [Dehalococcoidia bacterium]
MKFEGLPASASQVTPVPMAYVTSLLPQITDLAELKVTLHVMYLVTQKKTWPRGVTLAELKQDRTLQKSLSAAGRDAQMELQQGLALAVKRGILLQSTVKTDNGVQELFLVNTQSGREAAARISSGSQTSADEKTPLKTAEKSNQDIFSLYEDNFGLLTPMIAEQLKDMESTYPNGWIVEAFKVASTRNKRSLGTVGYLLKRWEREGKNDGESTGHTAAETDWERYIQKSQQRNAADR